MSTKEEIMRLIGLMEQIRPVLVDIYGEFESECGDSIDIYFGYSTILAGNHRSEFALALNKLKKHGVTGSASNQLLRSLIVLNEELEKRDKIQKGLEGVAKALFVYNTTSLVFERLSAMESDLVQLLGVDSLFSGDYA